MVSWYSSEVFIIVLEIERSTIYDQKQFYSVNSGNAFQEPKTVIGVVDMPFLL